MCGGDQCAKEGVWEGQELFKVAIGKNEGTGAEVGGPRL